MRVLIADKLAPHVATELESLGVAVTADPSLKDAALLDALGSVGPDVLVVRSTKVNAEHLSASPSLALVIRAGAGVNTIDLQSASNRGIYVANCPGKNAVAVAELAMGHLLNLDRRIADNVARLREGGWAKKEFGKARGIYGRTLAVLGTGAIGREVIRRAQAFGMKVRGWDKMLTPDDAIALGIEHCATALDACRGADALTVHLPLNDATRNLVNKELLEALAPGAYVINTSRGGIIDEAALVEACKSRGVRAGLDVYANEPGSGDSVFSDAICKDFNVYGTHHIGASTEQAETSVGDEVLRIVRTYLQTGEVPNCVNLASSTPATHTLVVRHADRVGVLAGVFEGLKQAGINVQEMDNIVFSGADAACARIAIDKPVPTSLLEQLQGSEHIYATTVVAREA